MLDIIRAIVNGLVKHPEEVSIRTIVKRHATVILIDAHPDDRGKLIGRGGNVVSAIRAILRALGGKDGKMYILEILEDTETQAKVA